MNEFLSSRRTIVVTTVASLLVLWAIIAIPGGPTWPGVASGSVLVVLLVATTKLVLGSPSPAPMSEVIRGVEGEKRPLPPR